MNTKKGNAWGLLPMGVFIVFYLTLGILFEYVMEIPMGFYNVPIVVAFLVVELRKEMHELMGVSSCDRSAPWLRHSG